MEGLAQSLAPSLLAIQRQEWDWTDNYAFVSHNTSATGIQGQSSEPESEPEDEDLWGILPDELLERILALLPVTNIFRAGAVCKRWNSIIASRRFLHLCEEVASTTPWYFMYRDTENAAGLAYDPVAKKWHNFELPRISPNRFVASANGLVCFMDNSNAYDLYICNPMTKVMRKLPEPTEKWSSDYYTVSMIVNKATKIHTTVVARSNQMPDDYSRWTLCIEVYDSASKKWRTTAQTLLHGWRGGDNSVICKGYFYCVTHSTAMMGGGDDTCRHGLISYQLSSGVLNVAPVGMPCSLTCVKLMNCNDKLVMVGGIGKSDIIKGIGIWELDTEWRDVAKMPNKYFRGFGEFDDVFSSSGTGDLIYINAFGSPQLLIYDMSQRSWRWSQKCPMVKKYPLHLFTGFCFEPRLEACA